MQSEQNTHRNPNSQVGYNVSREIELKIMTYYGAKDEIYDTLSKLSKKSLSFMKRNYKKIEYSPFLRHQNEYIRLQYDKTIEEHQ